MPRAQAYGPASAPPCYERHRPEDTVFYRTLEGHLEAFWPAPPSIRRSALQATSYPYAEGCDHLPG